MPNIRFVNRISDADVNPRDIEDTITPHFTQLKDSEEWKNYHPDLYGPLRWVDRGNPVEVHPEVLPSNVGGETVINSPYGQAMANGATINDIRDIDRAMDKAYPAENPKELSLKDRIKAILSDPNNKFIQSANRGDELNKSTEIKANSINPEVVKRYLASKQRDDDIKAYNEWAASQQPSAPQDVTYTPSVYNREDYSPYIEAPVYEQQPINLPEYVSSEQPQQAAEAPDLSYSLPDYGNSNPLSVSDILHYARAMNRG